MKYWNFMIWMWQTTELYAKLFIGVALYVGTTFFFPIDTQNMLLVALLVFCGAGAMGYLIYGLLKHKWEQYLRAQNDLIEHLRK
jgi:hypothetical protein